MKRKRYDEDRTDVSAIEFEWYPPKAESNFKKHKVSFELATTVFGDKKFVDFPDKDHSDYESRYLGIGRAENDRLLSVIFTTRET